MCWLRGLPLEIDSGGACGADHTITGTHGLRHLPTRQVRHIASAIDRRLIVRRIMSTALGHASNTMKRALAKLKRRGANLGHRAAGSRERGSVLARASDDLGLEEHGDTDGADGAGFCVFGVRKGDDALGTVERLDILEVDLALAEKLGLLDVVPVVNLDGEVYANA